MVDEEKLEADLAEAIGKASASLCVQAATVAALISRGTLTKEDAATLTAHANAALQEIEGLSDDAKFLGEAALRGFAQSWLKLVTRN